jgi:NADH-quinone oxidoreductase subunit L
MNPIALILFLPLLGFIFSGIFASKLPKLVSPWVSTLLVFLSFVLTLNQIGHIAGDATNKLTWEAYTFFNLDGVLFKAGFALDRLSIWMTLIITGIGTLIHVYSISYMEHDENIGKFFSYLNFFIFNMLLLVLGSNFLMLFFGWEGVGLCSYLLIGFWYKNPKYGEAARKAFIMNRIGDLGLLLGMFLIIKNIGSLDYDVVLQTIASGTINDVIVTSIAILLFIGAMGKSAQIPLFTWLPDAMAGPTPVSALIHAATMVTAGIYLVIRCQAMYVLSPMASQFVLWIGLATALIGAIIGLRQNDIKKVLAYSTVSQLGFMFVALGVGAYTTALFHVTTHAFFKALLFLGAGSVIHGVHHRQDINQMGGLKKMMPLTYWTFVIGTLAISGFPLLSGFFSKDEILTKVFQSNIIAYAILLVSATLTSIYMFRLLFLTFHGSFRGQDYKLEDVHESNWKMTTPLVILSILSVLGGLLNLPHYITHKSGVLVNWLNPTYVIDNTAGIAEPEFTTELLLIAAAISAFLIGFFYSRRKYITLNATAEIESQGFGKFIQGKFFIDELYQKIIVKPLEFFGDILFALVDTLLIYGLTFAINPVLNFIGRRNQRIQNGNIEFYLLYMVGALALLLGINLLFI